MKVITKAVKVDADSFVWLVMSCPVDDVWSRRADRDIKPELLPSAPLRKSCGQQEMPQTSFGFVDWLPFTVLGL